MASQDKERGRTAKWRIRYALDAAIKTPVIAELKEAKKLQYTTVLLRISRGK